MDAHFASWETEINFVKHSFAERESKEERMVLEERVN
jgi:hypothetical protein